MALYAFINSQLMHFCAFLGLKISERCIIGTKNVICWVLSCSPAPIRSISSVNLVEKGDVVLPPPDYLGSLQTDKRMESSKGTTVKTPTDRPENAGPVSNQYHDSKCSALLTFVGLLS